MNLPVCTYWHVPRLKYRQWRNWISERTKKRHLLLQSPIRNWRGISKTLVGYYYLRRFLLIKMRRISKRFDQVWVKVNFIIPNLFSIQLASKVEVFATCNVNLALGHHHLKGCNANRGVEYGNNWARRWRVTLDSGELRTTTLAWVYVVKLFRRLLVIQLSWEFNAAWKIFLIINKCLWYIFLMHFYIRSASLNATRVGIIHVQ